MLNLFRIFMKDMSVIYQAREIEEKIARILKRGKSILLFGARQTGKTTLLKRCYSADFYYNFASPKIRRQFEQYPDSLAEEINVFKKTNKKGVLPLVIIDEVQNIVSEHGIML